MWLHNAKELPWSCPIDGCVTVNASQGTAATGPAAFGFADHGVVIQDMIDAVAANREVVIPVTAVRPTLEMVLAMYHSAAKNQPVALPVQDDDSIWEM